MAVVPALHMLVGPMFAGKSTELLRLAERNELGRRTVALVNHAHDTRYGGAHKVTSHAKQTRDADATVHRIEEAIVSPRVIQADVVLIDEGQFFDDLVSGVRALVDMHRKIVIVTALSGTWEQKPFENVAELLAAADTATMLTAVCKQCGRDAPFTIRLSDETATKVVGSADKYEARCRACMTEPA